MSGYVAGEWSNFCVGVVGAAAALSGLLVVTVSINIERIMEYPTLPTRAGQTLIVFVVPLVLGVLVLIPNQPRAALGAELIAVGALTGVILLRINRPSNRSDKEPRIGWLLTRFLPSLAIAVLVTVAGISLMVKTGGGLYWIAPATILALVTGLTNSWVLLVEILR
jgi:hypothetical protein